MSSPLKSLFLALLCAPLIAFAAPEKDASPQINLDIGAPPVIIVRHAITQRQSRLVRFYDAGSIGMDNQGYLVLRDESRLSPGLKKVAEKLIDLENPDRRSLYHALAEMHGGQHLFDAAKTTQLKRWREQMHAGWWLQDDQGNWYQKP